MEGTFDDLYFAEMKKESEKMRYAGSLFLKDKKRGSLEHYKKWLKGYLYKGGEITHYYDYEMHTDKLYIISYDTEIPALYGAMSLMLIVEEGVLVAFPDGLGHNNVYYMDSHEVKGSWVPTYTNIIIDDQNYVSQKIRLRQE